MTIVSADREFVNGQPVPMSKDFVARFKFAQQPSCKAVVKCKYDSRNSPFWTDCDEGSQSLTIEKALLASGLQYLSVQASCPETDQLGPILTLFFYGVPDDYQPLMLSSINDGNGRHIIGLIKSDDCPESQQRFECAAAGEDGFGLCLNGNILDNPAPGYRVRMSCDGRIGPVLTL